MKREYFIPVRIKKKIIFNHHSGEREALIVHNICQTCIYGTRVGDKICIFELPAFNKFDCCLISEVLWWIDVTLTGRKQSPIGQHHILFYLNFFGCDLAFMVVDGLTSSTTMLPILSSENEFYDFDNINYAPFFSVNTCLESFL